MTERKIRKSIFSVGFDTKEIKGKVIEHRVTFETIVHDEESFVNKTFNLLESRHPDVQRFLKTFT